MNQGGIYYTQQYAMSVYTMNETHTLLYTSITRLFSLTAALAHYIYIIPPLIIQSGARHNQRNGTVAKSQNSNYIIFNVQKQYTVIPKHVHVLYTQLVLCSQLSEMLPVQFIVTAINGGFLAWQFYKAAAFIYMRQLRRGKTPPVQVVEGRSRPSQALVGAGCNNQILQHNGKLWLTFVQALICSCICTYQCLRWS